MSSWIKNTGLLVVISAPSGGGKTTILRRVFEQGNADFQYSISVTTRPQRSGEVDGKDYYFLSLAEFTKQRAQGDFVEWAEVHGHYYATPKTPIRKWIDDGKVVFCDLDVDGGLTVKKEFGDAALLVFVRPPSFESLVVRLKGRNTESDKQIEKRMQRYPKEMKKSELYDHLVVNENLDETVQQVLQIVNDAVVSG